MFDTRPNSRMYIRHKIHLPRQEVNGRFIFYIFIQFRIRKTEQILLLYPDSHFSLRGHLNLVLVLDLFSQLMKGVSILNSVNCPMDGVSTQGPSDDEGDAYMDVFAPPDEDIELITDKKGTDTAPSPDIVGYLNAACRKPIVLPSATKTGRVDVSWSINTEKGADVKLRYGINTDCVLCAAAFSWDGAYIAFSTSKMLYLLKTEDGSVFCKIELPQYEALNVVHTRIITFSRDGLYVALNGANDTVVVCSLHDRKTIAVLRGHAGRVSSIAFTKDGNRLFSGGTGGDLCVWEVPTFKLIHKISYGDEEKKKEDMIVAIDILADGSVVAIGFMDGTVRLLSGSLTSELAVFRAHESCLLCVTSCPHSQTLVTTSRDRTAKVWNLKDGTPECKLVLRGHRDCVVTAHFCNYNKQVLLTGSKDETIKAWDIETGEFLFTLNAHRNTLFQIDHHPTDPLFVSCGGDGLLCVWEYTTLGTKA